MTQTKWTLKSMNKAYQQGYMTGLAGKDNTECLYGNDILIAAWEAGWDDGYTQYQKAMEERRQVRYA